MEITLRANEYYFSWSGKPLIEKKSLGRNPFNEWIITGKQDSACVPAHNMEIFDK